MKRIISFLIMMIMISSSVFAYCVECENLYDETSCVEKLLVLKDTYVNDYTTNLDEYTITDRVVLQNRYFLNRGINEVHYKFIALDEDVDVNISIAKASLNLDFSSDIMTMRVSNLNENGVLESVQGTKSYPLYINTEYDIGYVRDGLSMIVTINGVETWNFDYSGLASNSLEEFSNSDSIYYGYTHSYLYSFRGFDLPDQFRLGRANSIFEVNEGRVGLIESSLTDEIFYTSNPRLRDNYAEMGRDYVEYVVCDGKILLEREVTNEYPEGIVSGEVLDESTNTEINGDTITITKDGVSKEFEFVSERQGFISQIPHYIIGFFRALVN